MKHLVSYALNGPSLPKGNKELYDLLGFSLLPVRLR